MGAFYLVFRPMELSAELGYTTRRGDVAYLPLRYDDRALYFHFLWYEGAGACEVIEDGAISTYWCTDLTDFFTQYFYEGPDVELDV